MGCFLRCFGFRNDQQRRNHLISGSISSTSKVTRDPRVAKKKSLGSFFLSEEDDQVANLSSQDSIYKDSSYTELKIEAKFLKSCGALLQTPLEIRRASAFVTNQRSHEDIVSSNFESRLSGTSGKKLLWDDEHGELCRSPVKAQESSWISENNSESCANKEHQTPKPHELALPSVCLSKEVGFEGVKTESGVELQTDNDEPDTFLHENKCWIQPNASRCSPFPTPLKVTDEMQTPATVYPANTYHVKPGKNVRIRTQYVYPVLNPVESTSQWKVLTEGFAEHTQSHNYEEKMNCNMKETQKISITSASMDSNLPGTQGIESSYDKSRKNIALIDNDEYHSEKTSINLSAPRDNGDRLILSSENQQVVVTSLSNWLKSPVLQNKGVNNKTDFTEKSHSGKSSDAERPIIGMVAAHWNNEGTAQTSPKCWDGNGIPNSTNKYKEDQRVSWHATPFEERLEKALSDESFLTQRSSLHGKLFGCENELSDTAAS